MTFCVNCTALIIKAQQGLRDYATALKRSIAVQLVRNTRVRRKDSELNSLCMI